MVYPPESMFKDLVDVRSLVGGTTAATFLYGISCAQVLYYFWHYTEDHFLFKTLAAFLWFLDTVTECLNITALWGYATKQFARNSSWYCTATYNSSLWYDCYPLTQQASNWMPSTGPPDVRVAADLLIDVSFVCTSIVTCIVQCFYVAIIWKVSPRTKYRIWLTTFLLVLIFVSCAAGLAIATSALQSGGVFPGFVLPPPEIRSFVTAEIFSMAPFGVHTGFAAIVDIEISICAYGFVSTRSMFSKLIQYAIQRALLTSVAQIAQTVLFYDSSDTWIAVQFIGSKLYVNCFLSIVNARNFIRNAGENADTLKLTNLSSTIHFADNIGTSDNLQDAGSPRPIISSASALQSLS